MNYYNEIKNELIIEK